MNLFRSIHEVTVELASQVSSVRVFCLHQNKMIFKLLQALQLVWCTVGVTYL